MEKIDKEILKFYNSLNDLDDDKKKFYHIKSIKNITKHILNDESKDSRVKKISLIRKKEELLNYYNIIFFGKNKNNSKYYFDNYVLKLGRFMNSYYGFAYCGGKMIILFLSIYIIIGVLLDFVFLLIFDKIFYISVFSFLIGISRALLKFYQNKTYGPNW